MHMHTIKIIRIKLKWWFTMENNNKLNKTKKKTITNIRIVFHLICSWSFSLSSTMIMRMIMNKTWLQTKKILPYLTLLDHYYSFFFVTVNIIVIIILSLLIVLVQQFNGRKKTHWFNYIKKKTFYINSSIRKKNRFKCNYCSSIDYLIGGLKQKSFSLINLHIVA